MKQIYIGERDILYKETETETDRQGMRERSETEKEGGGERKGARKRHKKRLCFHKCNNQAKPNNNDKK